MEDIGDYLYLLVFAVAGLSSLLKKRKKAKEVQEQENERPTVFEQILGEEEDWWNESKEKFETVSPAPPINPVVTKQTYATRDDLMGYESTSRFEDIKVRRQNIASVNRTEFELEELVDENQEDNQLDINLTGQDEAKRAFVYSEIFNRRY